VNAGDSSPGRAVPYPARRRRSPRDTLQVRWKELPVSETVVIKSADQVLPRLLLFFRISFINPRLKESHDFRATILGRQGFVQQL